MILGSSAICSLENGLRESLQIFMKWIQGLRFDFLAGPKCRRGLFNLSVHRAILPTVPFTPPSSKMYLLKH